MSWQTEAEAMREMPIDKVYEKLKGKYDISRQQVRAFFGNEEVKKTRILHLCDLHIPYNIDVLAQPEIHKYKNKVDTLILNGDIEDCQSISKFTKKYREPLVNEMVTAWQYIPMLHKFFNPKETIVNYGNHEWRLSAYVSDKLNDDVAELMPNTPLDLIIDDGFFRYDKRSKIKTYYEPLSRHYKISYTGNWFKQIGGTIFCHPKAYKNAILSTSEKAYDYFIKHGYVFDTLVLAHTHKLAMTRYGQQCFLIEGGSLCEEMDYASEGSLSRPQNKGFVYLEQTDQGHILKDSIKLNFLEVNT